jgi:hypothetical protein
VNWIELPTIEPNDKTAKNLAKQVADLETFRAEVTSPTPPAGHFYSGDEAINEALRRELILRMDIARYHQRKGENVTADTAAVAQVRKILDDREGHRR